MLCHFQQFFKKYQINEIRIKRKREQIMKKIINKVEDIVIEMCEGMVKAHPEQLSFNKKYKLITRKELNKNKVSLISGGGSGHEPAHALARNGRVFRADARPLAAFDQDGGGCAHPGANAYTRAAGRGDARRPGA